MPYLFKILIFNLLLVTSLSALPETVKSVIDHNIDVYKSRIRHHENYLKWANKSKQKNDRGIAYNKKELNRNKNELKEFQKRLKKNPLPIYKQFRDARINDYKRFIKRYGNKEYWNKRILNLKKDYELYYKTYLAQKKKDELKKKNIVKASTNKSTNSQVKIKSSQIMTHVSSKNINVSGKAKASVGAVSIGKD